MSLQDITQEECVNERVHIQFAYQAFISELEYISRERGALLLDATHALEEAAAQKLRVRLREQLSGYEN